MIFFFRMFVGAQTSMEYFSFGSHIPLVLQETHARLKEPSALQRIYEVLLKRW